MRERKRRYRRTKRCRTSKPFKISVLPCTYASDFCEKSRRLFFNLLSSSLGSAIGAVAAIATKSKISIGYMVAATNLSNFIIAPCQVLSQNFARIKASKKIQEKIENLINEGYHEKYKSFANCTQYVGEANAYPAFSYLYN